MQYNGSLHIGYTRIIRCSLPADFVERYRYVTIEWE